MRVPATAVQVLTCALSTRYRLGRQYSGYRGDFCAREFKKRQSRSLQSQGFYRIDTRSLAKSGGTEEQPRKPRSKVPQGRQRDREAGPGITGSPSTLRKAPPPASRQTIRAQPEVVLSCRAGTGLPKTKIQRTQEQEMNQLSSQRIGKNNTTATRITSIFRTVPVASQ